VRFYLKDSERRPDPEPVKTDDRTALLVGLLLWVAALVATILISGVSGALMWTCVAGLAIGVVLLIYAELRRRRRG
jgi:hypothetical protein